MIFRIITFTYHVTTCCNNPEALYVYRQFISVDLTCFLPLEMHVLLKRSGFLETPTIIELHSTNCKVPFAQYQLHSANCIVPIAQCQLHSASCAVPVAQYQLHSTSWTVPIAQCQLRSNSCTVPVAQNKFHSTNCTVPVAQ